MVDYGVYTFVFNLSGIRSYQYPGIIIINISEEWVREIIDSLDINPDIKAIIIDKNDRLLISDEKQKMLAKASIYRYIEDMLKDNNVSGYSVININNEETFIVYSLIDTLDWIFIKLIPYENIINDIIEVRKNLIIIAI